MTRKAALCATNSNWHLQLGHK